MSLAAQARGAYGERLAAEWYRKHGYEVLAQNWRIREGELDLIVGRGGLVRIGLDRAGLDRPGLVVFVEVKARAASRFGTPAEAITRAKALRIRRLAARWLAANHQRGVEVRFDVVSVLGSQVEVIEAAL